MQSATSAQEWEWIHQIGGDESTLNEHAAFKAVLDANSAFFHPNLACDVGSVDLVSYVNACVSEHVTRANASSVLQVAVALLGSFMQTGYTGPTLEFELKSYLPDALANQPDALNRQAVQLLRQDGEEAYHLTPSVLHLLFAKLILVDNASSLATRPTAAWWKLRTLFIQQRLLDNPSGTLNDAIAALATDVEAGLEHDEYLKSERNGRIVSELRARFFVEVGLIHHFYGRPAKALVEFKRAQEATQLKYELTGALGKRTKFQTFDVTQLVVIAESRDLSNALASPTTDSSAAKAPEGLALNDDTLLENIEYTDLESKGGKLQVIDQCILLCFCMNVKNANPADGLTSEQMKPFISRVLENPNNWMVHTMGLLLRSRIEAHKGRTAERSVLQLQAIVDQLGVEADATPAERLNHIYSISIPSKWELEAELADRLMSIGVVKSALDIFLRLELWDNVVSCYQMLEKNKQAEDLVRKQLEQDPRSPKLHCLLGDVTQEKKYYYDAWEISEGRYSRAMRSLGAIYFRIGNFAESVKCYGMALAINPLYENSWFVMGCAALRCEDWESAKNAFLQTVLINSDNGEAWTNLASVYVKQDKKRDGWRAIREALRQHHDNSKIWENYLFISLDLKEFSEAIRAMQRVFDIRANPLRAAELAKDPSSLVDLGCLEVLVHAVVHDVEPSEGTQRLSALVPQISRYLEGLCAKMSGSARLYTLCAQFYTACGLYRLALEYLEKTYRVYLNAPGLNEDPALFKSGADAAERLAEAYREFGPMDEAPRLEEDGSGAETVTAVPVCPDWRYQGRMALRTFIGRTKDCYEGMPEHDHLKELLVSFSASA
ncbi:hypothetical protein BC830DRAFT_1133906 [Chytriomyces sp. MP71]|nr:hypothetical protein BC830DRAFT_1133906 [Chytriomyces sp. MP71]